MLFLTLYSPSRVNSLCVVPLCIGMLIGCLQSDGMPDSRYVLPFQASQRQAQRKTSNPTFTFPDAAAGVRPPPTLPSTREDADAAYLAPVAVSPAGAGRGVPAKPHEPYEYDYSNSLLSLVSTNATVPWCRVLACIPLLGGSRFLVAAFWRFLFHLFQKYLLPFFSLSGTRTSRTVMVT